MVVREQKQQLAHQNEAPVKRIISQREITQRKVNRKSEVSEISLSHNESGFQGDLTTVPILAAQPTKNRTGMPDQLKARLENLSGFDLSELRVHRNSEKPAKINALAYAQGQDIHLGMGQDKHLPHEAWHVVQQMQGRVKPTTKIKDNLTINDDKTLEKEADMVGARYSSLRTRSHSRLKKIGVSRLVQRIKKEEAVDSFEKEQLIWYLDGEQYVQARISSNPRESKGEKLSIRLMNGVHEQVSFSELHLSNPKVQEEPAIAVKGTITLGPSKPVDGQKVINRGIVETEIVNEKPYVRVYSGVMSSVRFDTEDEQTGIATSKYKDIHQSSQSGKIIISSGDNNLLWAGLGRPLRALKWSEKYLAQILKEKQELGSLYTKYKVAVSTIQTQKVLIENCKRRIHELDLEKVRKEQGFNKANKKEARNRLSSRQDKSISLIYKKRQDCEDKIKSANYKIGNSKTIIKKSKYKLGKDANPAIRSFLIPFSSYEEISKNAIPEELNAVVPRSEAALKKNKELYKASEKGNMLSNILEYENDIKGVLKKDIKRSMPDLDVSNISLKDIVEKMKERGLNRSINVDRHYEPNQFGIKGADLSALRKDALPGSLITYTMFPNNMDKYKRKESGQIVHLNVLKDRLGVPSQDIKIKAPSKRSPGVSPWLDGDSFLERKKFKGNADELSMHYSTWLKSKDQKFDESAILAPKMSNIPHKRRMEMLNEFLKINDISPSETDDFMRNVVTLWASQSMISHVMADDYDKMEKDQNITKEIYVQDFAKLRYDLPMRRGNMNLNF